MKTEASYKNQCEAYRTVSISLIGTFIRNACKKEAAKDMEEWQALFEDSQRHPPHLAIIPLSVHLSVIRRMLNGQSYKSAMFEERALYTGNEFVAPEENKKKWSLL